MEPSEGSRVGVQSWWVPEAPFTVLLAKVTQAIFFFLEMITNTVYVLCKSFPRYTGGHGRRQDIPQDTWDMLEVGNRGVVPSSLHSQFQEQLLS